MLNLIIKDIIVYIKSERIKMLKYILVFILLYFFMNEISYYTIPVVVTYMFIIGIFSADCENNATRFIKSIPIDLNDIVYSRYFISVFVLIGSIFINAFLSDFLSYYMFREVVLNDVIFAIDISLTIMSISLALFFRYGYETIKVAAVAISAGIFIVMNSILNSLSENRHLELINEYSSSYGGSVGIFQKIFEGINTYVNIEFINIYSITAMSVIIFILSMAISIKSMNKNRYMK